MDLTEHKEEETSESSDFKKKVLMLQVQVRWHCFFSFFLQLSVKTGHQESQRLFGERNPKDRGSDEAARRR